jgi:hypothetical protein
MKSLLRFLFIWFLAWGAPFVVFPQWESAPPPLKSFFYSPEYILGIGFLVLVSFFIEQHYKNKKRARDALRHRQASGREHVSEAHSEPGAERTGQALIVDGPLTTPYSGSFQVWIDGEWDGEIRPLVANQFAVEPGEHTVTVSLGWFRSRRVAVTARPGTKTALTISFGSWWVIPLKLILPIFVCIVVALLITGGLQWAGVFPRPTFQWISGICVAVLVGYFLPASLLIRDYWAVFALEPSIASAAQQGDPEPAASADRPRDTRFFEP